MNTGFLGSAVATVLTVYGIETQVILHLLLLHKVATVLTVYGIETFREIRIFLIIVEPVATVLTVYGIETLNKTPYNYL